MAYRLFSAIGAGEPASGRRFSIILQRPAAGKGLGYGSALPFVSGAVALVLGLALVYSISRFHEDYVLSFRSPVQVRLQSPLIIAQREKTPAAARAQSDQEKSLTPYQQYACAKFGPACRVALAVQRAENPQGKCEVYHYNADGTLDWGYFQINTVHLKRRGVNLRDLLDCKANVDFAYRLYVEQGGFDSWSTYRTGAYRRYLKR